MVYLHIAYVSVGWGAKIIFEKIMAKSFPNLMKIVKDLRSLINPKKMKHKEKCLKVHPIQFNENQRYSAKREKYSLVREMKVQMTENFLS